MVNAIIRERTVSARSFIFIQLIWWVLFRAKKEKRTNNLMPHPLKNNYRDQHSKNELLPTIVLTGSYNFDLSELWYNSRSCRCRSRILSESDCINSQSTESLLMDGLVSKWYWRPKQITGQWMTKKVVLYLEIIGRNTNCTDKTKTSEMPEDFVGS